MSAVYLGLRVFATCRTTWMLLPMIQWQLPAGPCPSLSAGRSALSIAVHAALTGVLFGAAMV